MPVTASTPCGAARQGRPSAVLESTVPVAKYPVRSVAECTGQLISTGMRVKQPDSTPGPRLKSNCHPALLKRTTIVKGPGSAVRLDTPPAGRLASHLYDNVRCSVERSDSNDHFETASLRRAMQTPTTISELVSLRRRDGFEDLQRDEIFPLGSTARQGFPRSAVNDKSNPVILFGRYTV
jgi:hypothetical protein